MKINSIQRYYIIRKLIFIENILNEKYHGMLLNYELSKMVEYEAKEMLNQYIRNIFKIEDPEYILKLDTLNNSFKLSIFFSE